MRVNAHTTIIGETVVLVPYRCVVRSRIRIVVDYVDSSALAQSMLRSAIAAFSGHPFTHPEKHIPSLHLRKTIEIPHVDAERGATRAHSE
jgi:hypothetical protein